MFHFALSFPPCFFASRYPVWKMFCTILDEHFCAAASSAWQCRSERFTSKDPMFCFACDRFFAPGMGIVPLLMHHAIATCDGVACVSSATSTSSDSKGLIPGRMLRNTSPRSPPGSLVSSMPLPSLFPIAYLLVRSPRARGL